MGIVTMIVNGVTVHSFFHLLQIFWGPCVIHVRPLFNNNKKTLLHNKVISMFEYTHPSP